MSAPLSHFIIHQATVQDIPEMVDLVESVYRGDSSKKGWTTEADILGGQRTDAAMILDLMNQKKNFFFVGREQDRMVSSVHLSHQGEFAYLGMLAVSTAVQGLGVGKRMLSYCEQFARQQWGSSQMKITVISVREELIAWYKRHGYQETGQILDFPQDPRFGLPKIKDLKLVEYSKKI